MWRLLLRSALITLCLLPACDALAGEARAVMHVGITITGKDTRPSSSKGATTGQSAKTQVQPVGKTAPGQ